MRKQPPPLALLAFACASAGCSGGGGATAPLAVATPSATNTPAAIPTATPTATPTSQAMLLSIDVPVANALASSAYSNDSRALENSRRLPMFVSPSTKSVVVTIDEPNIAQMDLQHRVEPHNVVPGPNAFPVYAPNGTLTLKLSLFDQLDGKGTELARSVPNGDTPPSITLASGQPPQPITVTFNPIVVDVGIDPTSRHVIGNNFCAAFAGQLFVVGIDPDGNSTIGPGSYLDSNGDRVTFTVTSGDSHLGILQGVFGQFLGTNVGGSVSSSYKTLSYSETAPSTYGAFFWSLDIASTSSKITPRSALLDQTLCSPGGGG